MLTGDAQLLWSFDRDPVLWFFFLKVSTQKAPHILCLRLHNKGYSLLMAYLLLRSGFLCHEK